MTRFVVARKEFTDAIRSRTLRLLIGVFVGFSIAGTFVATALYPNQPQTSDLAVVILSGGAAWLVPLIALVVSYGAIVAERESGSLRILLSQPSSRQTILTGKMLGRAIVVALPIGIGFGVALISMLTTYDVVHVGQLLVFTLLTVALGTGFAVLGVGVSSALTSQRRTIAATMALYVLLRVGWDLGNGLLVYLVTGHVPLPSRTPPWYFLVDRLNPINAYLVLADSLLVTNPLNPLIAAPARPLDAVYMTDGFSLLVLLFWSVVPFVVGYRYFATIDIT